MFKYHEISNAIFLLLLKKCKTASKSASLLFVLLVERLGKAPPYIIQFRFKNFDVLDQCNNFW